MDLRARGIWDKFLSAHRFLKEICGANDK